MDHPIEQLHIKTPYKPELRKLVRHNMDMSYHVNRAIEMYLSQPAIQASLVELKKEPEAASKPFPCPTPDLNEDCAGCTDGRSEGTHAGCTRQHGHVGCELAEAKKRPEVTIKNDGV